LHQLLIYQLHLFNIKKIGPIVKIRVPHFVGKFEAWLSRLANEPPINITFI